MKQYVYGKNVVQSLLVEQKKIYSIYIVEGFSDSQLLNMIDQKHIKVHRSSKKILEKLVGEVNHQGIVAEIDAYKLYELQDLLQSMKDKKNPLFVILDEMQDPHNVGAILRTCDAVGVDGVLITKHRGATLNATVAKVSAGAIDTVKVAEVTNLAQAIQSLKKHGFWIVGTDVHEARDYREGIYDVPLAIVMGSEGFGIRPLVQKNCDYCITLPMIGKVESLNASVATGVLLYEVYNQRNPMK